VKQHQQELNANLQFQSDLIRLLRALGALDNRTVGPVEDELTKAGHETTV